MNKRSTAIEKIEKLKRKKRNKRIVIITYNIIISVVCLLFTIDRFYWPITTQDFGPSVQRFTDSVDAVEAIENNALENTKRINDLAKILDGLESTVRDEAELESRILQSYRDITNTVGRIKTERELFNSTVKEFTTRIENFQIGLQLIKEANEEAEESMKADLVQYPDFDWPSEK